MLKVGLTGGIGTGKSTVCDLFSSLFNISIIDADKINHTLLEQNGSAYTEVVELFGPNAVLSSGEIDKKYIRNKIFSNNLHRKKLENILHPKIRDEIGHQIDSVTSKYCIIAIPLLIESNMQSMVDRILLIESDQDLQIMRVSNRDQCQPGEVKAIIDAQINPEVRRSHADDIIHNNGNLQKLEQQIHTLHNKYIDLPS